MGCQRYFIVYFVFLETIFVVSGFGYYNKIPRLYDSPIFRSGKEASQFLSSRTKRKSQEEQQFEEDLYKMKQETEVKDMVTGKCKNLIQKIGQFNEQLKLRNCKYVDFANCPLQ